MQQKYCLRGVQEVSGDKLCGGQTSNGAPQENHSKIRCCDRLCLKNRRSTSRDIQQEFAAWSHVNVSTSLVRRRLIKNGLKARRPAKNHISPRKTLLPGLLGRKHTGIGLLSKGKRFSLVMRAHLNCLLL